MGVLSVGLFVTADVYGERGVDDVALCLHLCHLCVVDAYGHLLAVVAGFHMVPFVLPIGGQWGR